MKMKMLVNGKARTVLAIIAQMAELHPETKVKDLP
jgi:hypothetical protein